MGAARGLLDPRVMRQHYPEEIVTAAAKARRLAAWSIAYLATVVAAMALAMGSSQAMKTAWCDDALALVPPIAFLVSSPFTRRRSTGRFPYGYHCAASVAYLTGALALLGMGVYLEIDAVLSLAKHEVPTFHTVRVLGHEVGQLWLMIAVLVWSAVPAYLLGRAKRPVASALHHKALHADAEMNRADWMAAGAALVGIVLASRGLWWADALAGGVIGVEIMRDGVVNVKRAVHDVMDRIPELPGGGDDPVLSRVERAIRAKRWVQDVRVRLRELGPFAVGDVLVVVDPDGVSGADLLERLRALHDEVCAIDWRLDDVVIAPVLELPREHGKRLAEKPLERRNHHGATGQERHAEAAG